MSLADKLTLLSNTKSAIKTALENKGALVGTVPFSQYPAIIDGLSTDGGGGEPPGPSAFETMSAAATSEGLNAAIYIIYPEVDGVVAIYQDEAGTIPAAQQGDPIKYLVDLSGNEQHAIQTNGQPAGLTLATDGTGYWAVSDATMNRPMMPTGVISSATRSMVMGWQQSGSNDRFVISGAASDTGSLLLAGLNGSTSTTINASVTYTDVRGNGSAASLPTNRTHVWDLFTLNQVVTVLGLQFSSNFLTEPTFVLGYASGSWTAEGIFRSLVVTDKGLTGEDLDTVESFITDLPNGIGDTGGGGGDPVDPGAVGTLTMRDTAFPSGSGQNGIMFAITPEFDSQTVLWQDEEGGTPVTLPGQQVRRIDDISGNGYHATLGSSTNFIYQEDEFGHGYLSTDGSGYADLSAAMSVFRSADGYEVWMNVSMSGGQSSTPQTIFGVQTAELGNTSLRWAHTANTLESNVNGSRGSISGVPFAVNNAYRFSLTDSDSTVTANNSVTNTNSGSAVTETEVTAKLGTSADGTNPFDGRIYSFMVLPKAALTSSLIADLWSYHIGLNPIFDLYAIGGQSNAEGRGSSTSSPQLPPGEGYEFTGTSIVELNDPVGGAETGSAWPAFCNGYSSALGTIPLLVEHGVSGSSQHADADYGPGDWDDTGSLAANLIVGVNNMIAMANQYGLRHNWKGVLWSQGERDAQQIDASYTLDDYEAAFYRMLAKYNAELGDTKIWWSRTGERGDVDSGHDANYQAMRDRQDAIAAAEPNALMCFTGAYGFRDRGLMADNYHYTQAGYDEMGNAMRDAVASYTP